MVVVHRSTSAFVDAKKRPPTAPKAPEPPAVRLPPLYPQPKGIPLRALLTSIVEESGPLAPLVARLVADKATAAAANDLAKARAACGACLRPDATSAGLLLERLEAAFAALATAQRTLAEIDLQDALAQALQVPALTPAALSGLAALAQFIERPTALLDVTGFVGDGPTAVVLAAFPLHVRIPGRNGDVLARSLEAGFRSDGGFGRALFASPAPAAHAAALVGAYVTFWEAQQTKATLRQADALAELLDLHCELQLVGPAERPTSLHHTDYPDGDPMAADSLHIPTVSGKAQPWRELLALVQRVDQANAYMKLASDDRWRDAMKAACEGTEYFDIATLLTSVVASVPGGLTFPLSPALGPKAETVVAEWKALPEWARAIDRLRRLVLTLTRVAPADREMPPSVSAALLRGLAAMVLQEAKQNHQKRRPATTLRRRPSTTPR